MTGIHKVHIMKQHDQYKKEMHESISETLVRCKYEGVSEQFVYLVETLCYLAKDLDPDERHKAFNYLINIVKHDSCNQKRKATLRILARWRRAWLDFQLDKMYQQIRKVQKDDPSFVEFPEIEGTIKMYRIYLRTEREREGRHELDSLDSVTKLHMTIPGLFD